MSNRPAWTTASRGASVQSWDFRSGGNDRKALVPTLPRGRESSEAFPNPSARCRAAGIGGSHPALGSARPPSTAVTPARRTWSARWRRRCASGLLLVVLLVGAGAAENAAADSTTEAVQRALVERDFDPGPIDGAMGPRTRSALSAFQRAVGLPDTGRADAATLEALGLARPGPEDAPAESRMPQPGGPGTEAGTEAQPESGRESPVADAPGGEPTTEPGVDAVGSGSAGPDVSASDSAASGAGTPDAEPAAGATAAPEANAATKPRLGYPALGWHRPQTGAEALERLGALGVPRDFKRGTEPLFVPKSALVFVLKRGERIPGLDCDPSAGPLSIEFVFGPNGPVIFTPGPGGNYCRMGIGIALSVGRTLEMRRIEWGDARYPRGMVRLTNEGLEYVR